MRKLVLSLGALTLGAASLISTSAQAKTLDELLVEKGYISKAEAMATGGGAKVYWNKGSRFEFPDQGFTMTFATLLQPRYDFVDGDADAGEGNTSSFSVKRARVIVSGTALSNEFDYYMQYDMVGNHADDGSSSPTFLDGYLTWHACDNAWARMGQWKTGISRQYVASDQNLQFADRSIANDYFNLGRQAGAAVGGDVANGKVTWMAAIYNGNSDGEGINHAGNDTHHSGVLNVRWNPKGEMDTKAEGDVDWTEDAALSFGAAYAWQNPKTVAGNFDEHTINVDANLKVKGFALHGEFYYLNTDPDDGDSSNDVGFYVQAGYFVKPKKLEIAGRVSYVSFDDGAEFDDSSEASASLNYYWWKSHLKAQFGYSFLQDSPQDGDNINTNRWLLQLTSWF